MADRACALGGDVKAVPNLCARLNKPGLGKPYVPRPANGVYDRLGPGEEPDVRLVHELDVVWDPVDSHPVDGPARLERGPQLVNLCVVVTYGLVAGHAQAHGRNRGRGPYGDVPVAKRAGLHGPSAL